MLSIVEENGDKVSTISESFLIHRVVINSRDKQTSRLRLWRMCMEKFYWWSYRKRKIRQPSSRSYIIYANDTDWIIRTWCRIYSENESICVMLWDWIVISNGLQLLASDVSDATAAAVWKIRIPSGWIFLRIPRGVILTVNICIDYRIYGSGRQKNMMI